MHQWIVTKSKAEDLIRAHKVSVSPCGALLFWDADGLINKAYAKGHWEKFQLSQVAHHGYR